MHVNSSPTPCGHKKCKICDLIITMPSITISGHRLNLARFSCQSRNLIYIIISPDLKTCYYVGHTGQALATRISQHRNTKSKFKTFNYKIAAIQSSKSIVKRLTHENIMIKKLDPAWSTQRHKHWYSTASHTSQKEYQG